MRKETEQQQYCVTRNREQVPYAGIKDFFATVAVLGAFKLAESIGPFDLKNHQTIQNIKSEVKSALSMTVMALEVRYFGNGWVVPENHPLVDDLSIKEMKLIASAAHPI